MARLKKAWHRGQQARSVEELGHALAISAWKVARESVERILAADFDFEGERYRFALFEEWLAFFIHLTDRFAARRMDDLKRARLIKSMAVRLGETLQDNAEGRIDANGVRKRFIARVNEAGRDYADCSFREDVPGMNFLRCLGAGVCTAAPEIDRRWLMEQVVEVEAPHALKQYTRATVSLMSVELR